jgi:hypothetical protein
MVHIDFEALEVVVLTGGQYPELTRERQKPAASRQDRVIARIVLQRGAQCGEHALATDDVEVDRLAREATKMRGLARVFRAHAFEPVVKPELRGHRQVAPDPERAAEAIVTDDREVAPVLGIRAIRLQNAGVAEVVLGVGKQQRGTGHPGAAEKSRIQKAQAQRRLALRHRGGHSERHAGSAEIRLRQVEARIRGQRACIALRIGVGRQPHRQVVDHDRVALGDVDHEHDQSALTALAQRELDVSEKTGAEQAVARQLDFGIVYVEHIPGCEWHVTQDDARAGPRVATDLDGLQRVTNSRFIEPAPAGLSSALCAGRAQGAATRIRDGLGGRCRRGTRRRGIRRGRVVVGAPGVERGRGGLQSRGRRGSGRRKWLCTCGRNYENCCERERECEPGGGIPRSLGALGSMHDTGKSSARNRSPRDNCGGSGRAG